MCAAAPMNRQARRAAASKRRPDHRTPAELYRVAPDRIALTIDLWGRPPTTISITTSSLVDVLDGVAKLVADRTYQEVLHLFGAAITAADAGDNSAWNGGIVAYWLACHHPVAGGEMAARLADAIAISGCAHITMHGGQHRGVAFALADTFVDLDDVAALAREAGVATFVAAEPRLQRPGGRA
jgi:hypothetical protein